MADKDPLRKPQTKKEGLGMSTLLDGKAHSARVLEELKKVTQTLADNGVVPKLHVLLIGEDPASQIYVRTKARRAEAVGIRSEVTRLPDTSTAEEVLELIERLNNDPDTDGILVQLPLPGLPTRKILDAVNPEKDVDGFHPINAGLLSQKRDCLVSCTPLGVLSLLDAHDIQTEGRDALVVGRSDIVGRPMATLLTHRNATVTIAHSRTQNLEDFVGRADLLVVAMGRMHAVPAEWVKPGAIVIDVGIHRTEEGKLTGDVNPAGLSERASAYTPVPGGVGPMTIAMLLVNTTLAAIKRRGLDLDVAKHLVPKI